MGIVLLLCGLAIAYPVLLILFLTQHVVIAEILVAALAIIYGEIALGFIFDYFFKDEKKDREELAKAIAAAIVEALDERDKKKGGD